MLTTLLNECNNTNVRPLYKYKYLFISPHRQRYNVYSIEDDLKKGPAGRSIARRRRRRRPLEAQRRPWTYYECNIAKHLYQAFRQTNKKVINTRNRSANSRYSLNANSINVDVPRENNVGIKRLTRENYGRSDRFVSSMKFDEILPK